jgi:hypothetical protein
MVLTTRANQPDRALRLGKDTTSRVDGNLSKAVDVELMVSEPNPGSFKVPGRAPGDVQAEEGGEAIVEVVGGGSGALFDEEVGAGDSTSSDVGVPHAGACLDIAGLVDVPFDDDCTSNLGSDSGEDNVADLDNATFALFADLEDDARPSLVSELGAFAGQDAPSLSNHASSRGNVDGVSDDVMTSVKEDDLAVGELQEGGKP